MVDVVKHLLSVDMGNVVVLCQLLAEVRFACAGLANQTNLERFESAVLAELLLDKLNTAS
jgi:hypothetical protein